MSAADRVYAKVRHDIVFLHLKPGQLIKEKQVIDEMGVSRTPVREAFLRLEKEHLLEIRPQSGTMVSPIRLSRIRDAQFLRTSLEFAAAKKLMQQSNGKLLEPLQDIIDEQEFCYEHERFEQFVLLDNDFHRLFFELIGHQEIWKMLESARAHLDRIRFMFLPNKNHLQEVLDEHRIILNAIAEGDEKTLSTSMQDHLNKSEDLALELSKTSPEFFI